MKLNDIELHWYRNGKKAEARLLWPELTPLAVSLLLWLGRQQAAGIYVDLAEISAAYDWNSLTLPSDYVKKLRALNMVSDYHLTGRGWVVALNAGYRGKVPDICTQCGQVLYEGAAAQHKRK